MNNFKEPLENMKNSMRMRDFSDDVLKLIYGDDVDIKFVRQQKTFSDNLEDIISYMSINNNISIEEIKKMPITNVFDFLNKKLKIS